MIVPARRTANFHYAIRNIISAAEALERAGRKVIHLNIGDPQVFGFRPPPCVVDAVRRALSERFTGYAPSAGLSEAREAVAAYATNLGAPTKAEEVIITAGASEAADLVLTALVNEGDEVLLPAPGYPLYDAILNKLGAVARYYKLDAARGWRPAADEVRAAINERTRALLLINPNNPTGSITPDETTRQLLEVAAEHNLLVIADEVYRELCFTKPPVSSSVLAQESDIPIVTLESLSKTHMVPGWRVGWMRFTHAEKMEALIPHIMRLASGRLCSPTPAQYAVRTALEMDNSYLNEFTTEIKRRLDVALSHIKAIPDLSCVEPEAAFYMMLKVEDPLQREDKRFVLDFLEESKVLVVHGSGFGADPKQCYFRLVFLADEAMLDTSFNALRRFLELSHRIAT